MTDGKDIVCELRCPLGVLATRRRLIDAFVRGCIVPLKRPISKPERHNPGKARSGSIPERVSILDVFWYGFGRPQWRTEEIGGTLFVWGVF